MARFLIYQPNHGLGVELFLLETAFAVARALDRTLVIPPMPDLETTRYRRGLDAYFEIDGDAPWISFADFIATHGRSVDTTFHVIPNYRPEYASDVVRALHPVWTDNVERLTGLTCMGLDLGRVVTVRVGHRLTDEELAVTFASDARTIALSFVHGIAAEVPALDGPPAAKRPHVPVRTRDEYTDIARTFARQDTIAALHWRRRFHIRTMAKLLENGRLPTAAAMMRQVPAAADRIVVASDTRIDALTRLAAGKPVDRFRHRDPQINAVADIAICTAAEWFVGTYASTFSFFIAYARTMRGAPAGATTLL